MRPISQVFSSTLLDLLAQVRHILSFVPLLIIEQLVVIVGRTVPLAATRLYEMSFFTGFGGSAVIYITLNYFFPVPGASTKFKEIDVSTEAADDDKIDEESSYDKKEDIVGRVKSLQA